MIAQQIRKEKRLTTGDVARCCKVAPRTVSKWIDSGKLIGYRLPGSEDRRVTREDLLDFMQRHQMPLPPELQDGSVLSHGLAAHERIAGATPVDAFTLGVMSGTANIRAVVLTDFDGIEFAERTAMRIRDAHPSVTLVLVLSEGHPVYRPIKGVWDKMFTRPCNWAEIALYLGAESK